MTITGLEPIKDEIHAPAIEVAYGRLSLQQAYQRYDGMTLICPHCLKEWGLRHQDDTITEDRLGLKASQAVTVWEQWLKLGIQQIAPKDGLASGVSAFPNVLHVKFRKAALNENQTVKKWMHFCHTAPRADRTTKPPCHDPGCIDHTVALGAVQLMLEDEYSGQPEVEIIKENHVLLSPGATHATRCPDLLVTRLGQRERLLEVQSTVLSERTFSERTEHLLTLCPRMEWYFFKGTYSKMGPQRRWLSDRGLIYYCLRWDGYRLRVEEGRPPEQRDTRTTSRKPASACVYTEVDDSVAWKRAQQSNGFLPLSVVGKAEFVPRRQTPQAVQSASTARVHQFPEWGCSVKDKVEVWVEGCWRAGVVKTYTHEFTPVVELEKPVGRARQRLITPSAPASLKPRSLNLSRDESASGTEDVQQLSLLSFLQGG